MRNWLKLVALSTLVGLLGSSANANAALGQWTSIGPPGNYSVLAVAIDPVSPSNIYVGTLEGAAFRTSDAGGTWQSVNNGLPGSAVAALALSPPTISAPATLYAGTQGGVFKTTDRGMTWAPASSGITSIDIRALAIDPSAQATLYAAAAPTLPDGVHVNGGVFKTTNGGASWTAVNSGLTSTDVRVLAIDPVSPSTIYAGGFGGVFKSSNGGTSWVVALNGGTFSYAVPSSLALDPRSPTTIYVGQYYSGPYAGSPPSYGEVAKSTDAGSSWVGVNNGFDHPYRPAIMSLVVDPLSPSTVYAGTRKGGVFRTVDGGSSWVAVNGGLDNPAALTVAALAVDPRSPTTLYAGIFYRGLFRITFGPDTCVAGPTALCLNSGRFRVEVSWRTLSGASGAGQAVPMSSDAGSFWFFSSNNVELVVKVVDGRAFNNKFWVFYGALSNVEYTITVTDTQTGVVKTYFNPQGQLASVADTAAF